MENEIITYVKKDINAERMAFLASKFGLAPLYLSYSDYEEATEEERESVFGVELWCEADLREALEALDIDPVWVSEYGSYKCKSGGTDALILLDVKSAEE